jgi:outer membrane protein TolC
LEGSKIWEGLDSPPDGRSWTVGGVFSVPIGNHTARGNYRRDKLFVRQQEQRLMKVKQDAMLGVRLAVHSLASNRILVESTKQARILEQANVAAEEKRLKIGVTTAQNVLDKQEDLTAAQAREVRAQVDFERSLVNLQVAEGTLLENMNLVPSTAAVTEDDPGFFKSLLGPGVDK